LRELIRAVEGRLSFVEGACEDDDEEDEDEAAVVEGVDGRLIAAATTLFTSFMEVDDNEEDPDGCFGRCFGRDFCASRMACSLGGGVFGGCESTYAHTHFHTIPTGELARETVANSMEASRRRDCTNENASGRVLSFFSLKDRSNERKFGRTSNDCRLVHASLSPCIAFTLAADAPVVVTTE